MLRLNNITTFWFGMLGAFLFICSSILGGFLFENYSHIEQLISESYAIDTKYGVYLRLFGYIPSGILITFFSLSSIRLIKNSSLSKLGLFCFGIFYGIGTIIVSIFPCDAGCNKESINISVSQLVHNITGAITYLVVPISLLLVGINARKWSNGKLISNISILAGVIAMLFTYLLSTNPFGGLIGLYQRIIEGSILFWLINFAFYIKKHSVD